MVENLAFQKQVSIFANVGATWKDIFASFAELRGDRESQEYRTGNVNIAFRQHGGDPL